LTAEVLIIHCQSVAEAKQEVSFFFVLFLMKNDDDFLESFDSKAASSKTEAST
jgi:hypothetical protein